MCLNILHLAGLRGKGSKYSYLNWSTICNPIQTSASSKDHLRGLAYKRYTSIPKYLSNTKWDGEMQF